jgi:hypothetical protein
MQSAATAPPVRRFARTVSAAILASLALLAQAEGAEAGAAPLQLRLQNAGPVPLRCVLILAHFVSVDLRPMPPGGSTELALLRDSGAGTLVLPRADGRPMMVENLLCGDAGRWAETRGEVPLLALRAATAGRATLACTAVTRLQCTSP